MIKQVKIGDINVGGNSSLFLIAGPCVIENESMCINLAEKLKEITSKLDIPFIFKASFDKANRTSLKSFRGPGINNGLGILKKVREETGLNILTDIHCVRQVELVTEVADVIQIPAFLCRQTDLITAVAATNKAVNIKKGQFLAPGDIKHVINKVISNGNNNLLITERGVSFGYNNLVSDMRAFPIMHKFGYPVVFDATHSVQLPGGGKTSSGNREFVPVLSKAAVAAGCDGLYMETHFNPDKALSDGANMITPTKLENILVEVKKIRKVLDDNNVN